MHNVGQHMVDYQLTVDQVQIKCQLSIDWDVNCVLIGMSIKGVYRQLTALARNLVHMLLARFMSILV